MNFSIFPAFSSPLGIWDWENLCVLVLTFYTVLFQMVLVPLRLERKHLPTAFPLNFPSGMGNKGEGPVCFPAQDLLVCLHSILKAEVPENYTSYIAWKSFYFAFCRFIEEKSSFEYGQVNHALAAAMRTLIKEYMILITQLEHLQRQGLLSLQKLWFYIQPTMRTLEILASLGKYPKYCPYLLPACENRAG